MEIIVKQWTVSPYFICFLGSFIAAYVYVATGLYRCGMPKSYIVYSALLNTVCILYFGWAFTMVTQWQEYGEITSVGFSSLGGMMGMLLGVWIFTRIVKDHKEDILRTYVMSLGLMYGISKLGCFFCRVLSWNRISWCRICFLCERSGNLRKNVSDTAGRVDKFSVFVFIGE